MASGVFLAFPSGFVPFIPAGESTAPSNPEFQPGFKLNAELKFAALSGTEPGGADRKPG